MKKHIWIINQFAGTPYNSAGERHYFLAKYWLKKGYKVSIISGSFNHLYKNQPKIGKSRFTIENIEEDFNFCWVKIPKFEQETVFRLWAMIVFAYKVLSTPHKIIGKPDIIIVSSMPIFSILTGWILKKRFKIKKLIFEIRDLWPLTPMHLKGYSKWHPVIIVIGWFEKFGYRRADKIVSLLPNAYHYINKISKNESKFNYIPNGIDENLLEKDTLPENIINQIPKDKFIIGYAGTIGLANTMEFFVEAAKKCLNTNYHYILVGGGNCKKELQEKAKNLKNITFIDKVKKSQVQHVLSYFNICYLGRYDTPLYNHGVSYNKYFDYMLAKKPILESSNFIKDQVELSGCGIIVQPENVDAILNGINQLYNMSEEERSQMAKKGYDFVKKYHNFDYLSDKYIELFT